MISIRLSQNVKLIRFGKVCQKSLEKRISLIMFVFISRNNPNSETLTVFRSEWFIKVFDASETSTSSFPRMQLRNAFSIKSILRNLL